MESLQPAASIAQICIGGESIVLAINGLTKAGVSLVESAAKSVYHEMIIDVTRNCCVAFDLFGNKCKRNRDHDQPCELQSSP